MTSSAAGYALVVPINLLWIQSAPVVTFGRIDARALKSRPFLHEALREAVPVGLAPLDELPEQAPSVSIAGAIFHMSRCGSTLLCRQFAALKRVAVLSEPFSFQQLLEGPSGPDALLARRLRKLAAAWAGSVSPIADHLVIKWPLCLSHRASEVAEALSTSPMIFLHRDPVEVMASIERESLGRLRNVRDDYLLDEDVRARPSDSVRLCASMIGKACRRVSEASTLRTLNYNLLPGAAWESLAPHFGFRLTPPDRAAMMEAARAPSKTSRLNTVFQSDGQTKRGEISDAGRDYAERLIRPELDHALGRLRKLA